MPLAVGAALTADSRSLDPFVAFLNDADRAQLEFQQGRPDPYKALWSQSSDVTLIGGFGGEIAQGWDQVSKRLDWASSNFRNGRNEIGRLAFASNGNLGYLIQNERLVFTTPQNQAAERSYRVTMLFRREQGAWRIIHRHADAQTVKDQPR